MLNMGDKVLQLWSATAIISLRLPCWSEGFTQPQPCIATMDTSWNSVVFAWSDWITPRLTLTIHWLVLADGTGRCKATLSRHHETQPKPTMVTPLTAWGRAFCQCRILPISCAAESTQPGWEYEFGSWNQCALFTWWLAYFMITCGGKRRSKEQK
jgi:hypothetical protein